MKGEPWLNQSLYEAKAVKFYPYRTARIKGMLVHVPYGKDTFHSRDIEELEARLCKELGKTPDNHIVIEVTVFGMPMALGFSDWKMTIGLGVEPVY